MNLLLEIGCEEIPDWMLAGALDYLSGAIGPLVGGAQVRTDATPRRLTVRADGIAEREPDTEERVWGPAKSAPQAAVAGFAKKQGIAPEQLEVLSDGKNEKYTLVRKTAGRATIEILAGALPQLILRTPFPKTMYWPGKGGARFIRPIRWIVALLGDRVIPFEIAGVKSSNESSGHRKLGASRFPVTYADYEQKLRDNYVLISAEEREHRIRAVPTKYKCDKDLLNTLVNLTEWPTPITGSFDPAFLDLPKEVLITVMRVHQKYFSVEGADGKLAPQFVAVTNTDGDPEGFIRLGNERVLFARFNDARFFWDSDQKKPLTDRVPDLANVTFQQKLGTYREKTDRIVDLVKQMGGSVSAERAALLCKTDLTTELVKEFTELQGVIGGLYARAQGELAEVADAIYDQYKPASMEDSIPRTREGQIVSIADKLDTLRGCFRVGLIPTGTKDPFALRRAAQGVVRILVEGKLRLPIRELLSGDAQLEDFFLDRVRYYFREIRGFAYDEVNAVLASGWNDLVDVEERLEGVRAVRGTENFEPVAAAFKRIKNILKQAEFASDGSVADPSLLEAGPEASLATAYETARARLAPLSYAGKLESVAALRPQIDLFFDKVLVNAPDPAVRRNRLTLLHAMLSEFSTIADFSEIVTSSQKVTGE
ncbi:MAG TPA: glycine--tRNA ligase subunit beta [Bryobacteraceae bacterium]|nr:glycine--tRNA ligase subunit beta [Bryobacteraceae bacterium]